MKVFISYASQDAAVAEQVVTALRQAGIDIWYDKQEIAPGENWGERIAEGLKQSDSMVLLMSPDALHSSRVGWDLDYALGEPTYSNRLITVLVGGEDQFPEQKIPWILRRLKMVRLAGSGAGPEDLSKIAEAIKEVA